MRGNRGASAGTMDRGNNRGDSAGNRGNDRAARPAIGGGSRRRSRWHRGKFAIAPAPWIRVAVAVVIKVGNRSVPKLQFQTAAALSAAAAAVQLAPAVRAAPPAWAAEAAGGRAVAGVQAVADGAVANKNGREARNPERIDDDETHAPCYLLWLSPSEPLLDSGTISE